MTSLIKDIRYGFRAWWKRPAFTAVALLSLALGIGVNTALFTLFNVFLRPKPIKDPSTVVQIQYEGTRRENRFTFPEYTYLRDHSQSFSDVIANFNEKFLLGEKTSGVQLEEIIGNFVSDNYLAALGGSTRLGRFFTVDENRVAGRDAVVVLSHHFWQRRFAGDPQIVGRSLLLNGKPFTVIGVTGSDFVGLRYEMPDVWVPLMMRSTMATVYFEDNTPQKGDWFDKQEVEWLTLNARLRPGVTLDQARAELALLSNQLPRLPAAGETPAIVSAVRVGDIGGDNEVWPVMAGVLSATGLVLLIACSNITNMLLARGAARQKEIGIRLCLGASRWRVVRQLLIENLLLAFVGGVAGVLLAWWSLNLFFAVLIQRYGGGDVARLVVDLSPDARVLIFSLILTLLAGLAFGLTPALHATRPNLIRIIKDDSQGAGRSARSWLRSGLVVIQVSLCLVMLVAAGLLLRGLNRVLKSDPGFDAKNLLYVGYSLELSDYDQRRAELFDQQLVNHLSALPGVQSVTAESEFGGRVTVKLLDSAGGVTEFARVPFEWVTPNYFQTLGVGIVQGRDFTADELRSKAPIIVVTESTARNLWPSANPIHQTMRVERTLRNGYTEVVFPTAEVIGVVRDNQMYRVGQIAPMFFYAPRMRSEVMDTALLVRAVGDAAAIRESVRREAYALEPVLRLEVTPMTERIARDSSVNETRAASELASALGGLALLLATIGIYGVMAWSVSQRTREIGIRMALGARKVDVMQLVLRRGMGLALTGIIIGIGLSLAVTQLMKSLLFGLSTFDPITFISVSLALSAVAFIACYVPARRATKVDPLVALRYE